MGFTSREQALKNALASSRMEGFPVARQTKQDCRRLLNGAVPPTDSSRDSGPPRTAERLILSPIRLKDRHKIAIRAHWCWSTSWTSATRAHWPRWNERRLPPKPPNGKANRLPKPLALRTIAPSNDICLRASTPGPGKCAV